MAPWRASAAKRRPPISLPRPRTPPRRRHPVPPPLSRRPPSPPLPPSRSSSGIKRQHGSVSGSGGLHLTAKCGSYANAKPTKQGLRSEAKALSDSGGVHSTVKSESGSDSGSSSSEKPAKKRRIESGSSTESETAADDDKAGQLIQRLLQSGSDGVQCTAAGSSTGALEPKKEHSVYPGNSGVSGGGQHSTPPLTLLFIDVGDVEDQLKLDVFEDERLDPDQDTLADIDGVLEEVEPDMYFRPLLIKYLKTEWQYGSYGDWEEDSVEEITLQDTPYEGTMMTWRRLSPCNSIMKFFFVRIPECHRESIYYVNHNKRGDIARNIFQLLEETTSPFLVIGNLGFALATLIRFLRKFDDANSSSLEARLQIICSADQKILALFKNKENEIISQKELKGNPECLCIDISWNGSGIDQSTDRGDQSDATGASRRKEYLKLMAIGDSCEEVRGQSRHFNEILKKHVKLRPVVSSSSKSAYTGAIDIDATLRALDDSFKLLKQARAYAGVYQNKRPLDKKEMGDAIGWLRQRFMNYFMENEVLYNRVQSAASDALMGKAKNKLRKDIRGPFKVWLHSLVGNTEFCMAVLRNGYFDSQQQLDLLHAVLQERAEREEEAQLPEHERKALKKAAQAARKAFRDAQKLQAKGLPDKKLTSPQIELLRDLERNVLYENMIKANKAYKHGEGAEIRTREAAALLRMSCNALQDYWA